MKSVPHRGGLSALIALGLLSFFAACKRAPPPPPPAPPALALVNGDPIPLTRVQAELDRMRRGTGNGEAKIAAQEVPRLARALLDAQIDRVIVLQRAKAAGMSVSEAEVQRATDALADDARKGGAAWNDQLARDGQSAEQLSDEMRERLLAARYVTEETRGERASAAETRAFYDTHRSLFEEPEAVHCLQIAVRTPDEAKSILDQLRAGAPIRQAGAAGGNLSRRARGWRPGLDLPGHHAQGVRGHLLLAAERKISGVVQSSYGFHVFKSLGRRAARARKFEEVKAEAERRATAEKRAQAERQLLQQLRSSATVQIDTAALARVR